jgi:hypothetical protein
MRPPVSAVAELEVPKSVRLGRVLPTPQHIPQLAVDVLDVIDGVFYSPIRFTASGSDLERNVVGPEVGKSAAYEGSNRCTVLTRGIRIFRLIVCALNVMLSECKLVQEPGKQTLDLRHRAICVLDKINESASCFSNVIYIHAASSHGRAQAPGSHPPTDGRLV